MLQIINLKTKEIEHLEIDLKKNIKTAESAETRI